LVGESRALVHGTRAGYKAKRPAPCPNRGAGVGHAFDESIFAKMKTEARAKSYAGSSFYAARKDLRQVMPHVGRIAARDEEA
jgi:hypothetical protein